MRRRGLFIACMLVGLSVSGERAFANGVIVVPVQTTVLVPRTGIFQRAPASGPAYKGHLRHLLRRGSAPACETATYYEVRWVQSAVIVPNPIRPCYPPKPPPLPSPQAPEPPHPSPQSPHMHAAPSAQAAVPGGCGRCWPWCFMSPRELRCTCCIHMKRDVKDSAEAIDLVNKINSGQIGFLPIHFPFVAGAVADAVSTPDPVPYPLPTP